MAWRPTTTWCTRRLTLTSAGGITQLSGIVTAGTLTGSSFGATRLTGANRVSNLGNFTTTGFIPVNDFTLFNTVPLTQLAGTTVNAGLSTILIDNGGAPFH